ncbi:hypothetical protein JRQ81_019423 [Phrynocephalus forsythii]|uniref:Uncharacterized protein n=1 Tax=Phrynocephalus forsythii TaxID=171643 RepID=A0A9Q1AYI5_9SAUR|nr:hypothetical protein JRQ81_019423 [Phrynocephalus forsythii]
MDQKSSFKALQSYETFQLTLGAHHGPHGRGAGKFLHASEPLRLFPPPQGDTMLKQQLYEKVPVILVGNKVDLESEREVSSSEGRALAEEWGCPFMETSAKSKTMVDELFAEIVRQMNYASQPDKDDPCCSACNIQ